MNLEIVERLGQTAIHAAWQGAAFAIPLAAALRFMRNRSAAARHAACLLALAALLAISIVTFARVGTPRNPAAVAADRLMESHAVGSSQRSDPDDSEAKIAPLAPSRTATQGMTASSSVISTMPEPAASEATAPVPLIPSSAVPWIGRAWLCGILLFSLRHIGGWWRVRALRLRETTDVPEEVRRLCAMLGNRLGMHRVARVLASARASVPMLAGVLRPVILLPVIVLTGLSSRELEAVIAHELAHLCRRDTWAQLFQVVVETLFFWHPAVWWIGHRARVERENATDDLALQVCEDRVIYAGTLARLAEISPGSIPALAATGGSLLNRIRRVVGRPEQPESSPGWVAAGVAVVFGASLVASLLAKADAIRIMPGESIQAAIDAAAPGAVIELAEGIFDERITIAKRITLKGAGWDKTLLRPSTLEADPPPSECLAVELRHSLARSEEEKKSLRELFAERWSRPTVTVRAADATIAAMRISATLPKELDPEFIGQGILIRFSGGKSSVRDCVVNGPFWHGIEVTDGADVEVSSTLVAAVWGTGVKVYNRDGKIGSRLRLIESEVRNCYHRCVVIGPGCDTTVVEKCRISGSAWHGIRYDDASPSILSNHVFGSAGLGIYASGKTTATVVGNVLSKNSGGGMWCLYSNADIIEGNVFRNNESGLFVSGAGKPVVRENLFDGNPVAIGRSILNAGGKAGAVVGDPILESNGFLNNKNILQHEGSIAPTPAGSQLLTDAEGAAPFLAKSQAAPISESSWSLLAEEKLIIPDQRTRDRREWKKPAADRAAIARRNAIYQDPYDLKDKAGGFDPAKREAAIARIRASLASNNDNEIRAGLSTYQHFQPVIVEKGSFRDAIMALLKSREDDVRSTAASLLGTAGLNEKDLPLVARLADDPSVGVKKATASLAVICSGNDLTKGGADIILKLLNSQNSALEIAGMHPLWGVKTTSEIQDRLVAFSRESFAGGPGAPSYDAMYYGLSTSPNKTEATVKRLIELLSDPDSGNVGGRACWGLGQGVAREQYAIVADGMIKLLGRRADGYLMESVMRNLSSYGSAANLPAIKALLAKPGTEGEFRKKLQDLEAQWER